MRKLRIAIGLLATFIAVAPAAFSETFTVTTDADSGAGSLREAITFANSNNEADEIVFAADYTIVVDSPLPYVTSVIAITGHGWDRSVITGSPRMDEKILSVAPTGNLVVDSVMLRNENPESDAQGVSNDGEFIFLNSRTERKLNAYMGPGDLLFDYDVQSVDESEGPATIGVTRWDGDEGDVSVTYSTSDGTAIEGIDYREASGVLSWVAGDEDTKWFDVEIIDNSDSDGDRTVNLTLTEPTGGAAIPSPSATLIIIDNDGGAGELSYSDFKFFADENGGTADVTVSRGVGSSGPVSVSYATEDLSAIAGTDYTAVSGILTWAAGETASKTFTVPILDDSSANRTKLVRLTLTSPDGGASLGDQDTAVVVITDDDGPAGCAVDNDHLCLLDDRFKIETEWRDQRTGNHGLGTAVDESDKSGFMWFFNASNIELIVKMLDGRAITGAWWLFYGGLSDVEYWIVATDTVTGEQPNVYRNVPYDICGLGDTSAFPDNKMAGILTGSAVPMSEGDFNLDSQTVSKAAFAAQGDCVSDDITLCLFDSRFQVTVDWRDHRTGNTGVGTVVPITDNTGSFWFDNPESLELVVKVLDGTPVNGKFWVFYGALSDVVYTITVTDTETSAVKEYVNEAGNICGLGDTSAFDPS